MGPRKGYALGALALLLACGPGTPPDPIPRPEQCNNQQDDDDDQKTDCADPDCFPAPECTRCGKEHQPCCAPEPHCADGLACDALTHLCEPCGALGGPCCAGASCDGGLACTGGVCAVTCDGGCAACGGQGEPCCASGAACQSPLECTGWSCQPCGGDGQRCCGQGSCNREDLACRSGTCAPCGEPGQPCCAGSTPCQGGAQCANGTCGAAPTCGGQAQACCTDGGPACTAPLICDPVTSSCVPCGGNGQLCCSGDSCDGGLRCAGGACTPCGGKDQACCATGPSCNSPYQCLDGTCRSCGGIGQACCANGSCSGVLACIGDTCRSCGGLGEPCCTGSSPCGGSGVCEGGTCRPPNDHCANALDLSLFGGNQAFEVAATTQGATLDPLSTREAPCQANRAPDVWFKFTVPSGAPHLVYVDSFSASWDTVLFFADSCTAARPLSSASSKLQECNDDASAAPGDGCAGSTRKQSTIVGYFPPNSTRYIVLSGANGATGPATLRVLHQPTGNNGASSGTGAPAPLPLASGSRTLTGTTQGTGVMNPNSQGIAACFTSGGITIPAWETGAGPEQSYFWTSCPEYAGGAFSATTCGQSSFWDTVLYLTTVGETTAARGTQCDDDDGTSACNPGYGSFSLIPEPTENGGKVNVVPGAGLHILTLDGRLGGGSYRIDVNRP